MRLLLEPGSERLCWTHPSTGRPDARFALDVTTDVLGVVLAPQKPKMRRGGIWGRVGEGLGADGEFLPLLVGHGLRGAREAAVFDGRQDADFIREVRGLRKQNTCQVVTSAFRASRQEAGGSRGLVGSLTAPCQHIPFRITAEPAGAPTSVDIFIHSLRHQLASESRSAFDEPCQPVQLTAHRRGKAGPAR